MCEKRSSGYVLFSTHFFNHEPHGRGGESGGIYSFAFVSFDDVLKRASELRELCGRARRYQNEPHFSGVSVLSVFSAAPECRSSFTAAQWPAE
jgi:hypothetical protein